jgi:hypothetical protein
MPKRMFLSGIITALLTLNGATIQAADASAKSSPKAATKAAAKTKSKVPVKAAPTTVTTPAAAAELDPAMKGFKEYQADFSLKKGQDIFKRYETLVKQADERSVTQKDLVERYHLINEVVKLNPDWADGYWLIASEAFQLASTYIKDEEHAEAIRIYSEGAAAAEKCASMTPGSPMCNDFLGADMAKVAMLKGVFSSLRSAQKIEQLWQSVVTSNINFRFTREVTLQGSAHYALGMFYRLVPDSVILQWLFGTRGNIDRSIHHHRQTVAIDGVTPCGNVMLAASLLCKSKGEPKVSETEEAFKLIDQVIGYKSFDLNQRNCAMKASTLKGEPENGCGFTIAIQLDTEPTEENLKKSTSDKSPIDKK